VSRLATIVGALSAIVSLVDYLVARSFLSHWLQRQIHHGADGWKVSPTLNLLAIVGMVGLVWLATEATVSDPDARKRLFRLRANLVLGSLAAWFFFGPSIGEIEIVRSSNPDSEHVASSAPPPTGQGDVAMTAQTNAVPGQPAAHGHTSQFTWNRTPQPPGSVAWKPGDGLRAMARMLEEASGPSRTPPR
jgi:hypothetical protein